MKIIENEKGTNKKEGVAETKRSEEAEEFNVWDTLFHIFNVKHGCFMGKLLFKTLSHKVQPPLIILVHSL